MFCRADFGPRLHFDEPLRPIVTLPGLVNGSTLGADWINPLTGERRESSLEVRARMPLVAPFGGPFVVRLRLSGGS